MLKTFSTKVDKKVLDKVAKNIFKLDNPDLYLKKVVRLMNDRYNMFFKMDKIDWQLLNCLHMEPCWIKIIMLESPVKMRERKHFLIDMQY